MGLFGFDYDQGSLHWTGDVRAKIWLRQSMLNLKNEDVTQREQEVQRPWNESMPWMCASNKEEVRVIWEWVSESVVVMRFQGVPGWLYQEEPG